MKIIRLIIRRILPIATCLKYFWNMYDLDQERKIERKEDAVLSHEKLIEVNANLPI